MKTIILLLMLLAPAAARAQTDCQPVGAVNAITAMTAVRAIALNCVPSSCPDGEAAGGIDINGNAIGCVNPSTPSEPFSVDYPAFVVNNGNVGISTGDPQVKLDVNGNVQIDKPFSLSIPELTPNDNSLIPFLNGASGLVAATDLIYLPSGSMRPQLGWVVPPVNSLDLQGNEAIGSYAGVDAAPPYSLIVSSSIGIGTPNPASALHLSSGTLLIDGNVAASINAVGTVSASQFIGALDVAYSSTAISVSNTSTFVSGDSICNSTIAVTTSGGDVVVTFQGSAAFSSSSGGMGVSFLMDGKLVENQNNTTGTMVTQAVAAAAAGNLSFSRRLHGVSAGLHKFCVLFRAPSSSELDSTGFSDTFEAWEVR